MKRKVVMFLGILAVVVALQQAYCCLYTPVTDRRMLEEAEAYCRANGMNDQWCVFVDFRIPSGKPRLYVADLRHGTVMLKGLCAHGSGGGSTASRPRFSNRAGSRCSSPGKYRIGRFVRHRRLSRVYTLDGLEDTNSNARSRGILIHPSKAITLFGFGCFPFYIPLGSISSGCFSVSSGTFTRLSEVIEGSDKPLLLWAIASEEQ